MNILLGQLRQLGTVAVVMLCAAGGTAGLIKLIRRFTPEDGFPRDPFSKGPEEDRGDKKCDGTP